MGIGHSPSSSLHSMQETMKIVAKNVKKRENRDENCDFSQVRTRNQDRALAAGAEHMQKKCCLIEPRQSPNQEKAISNKHITAQLTKTNAGNQPKKQAVCTQRGER